MQEFKGGEVMEKPGRQCEGILGINMKNNERFKKSFIRFHTDRQVRLITARLHDSTNCLSFCFVLNLGTI